MGHPLFSQRLASLKRSYWAQSGRKRRILLQTIVLSISGLLLALLALAGPLPGVRSTLSDQLFIDGAASDSIIIVAIDEATLGTSFEWDTSEGRWTASEGQGKRLLEWPRSIHAQAISNLIQAQARVIGFDLLFSEASDPVEDQALSSAISQSGNVVLPMLGTQEIPASNDMPAFKAFLQSMPSLQDASAAHGHANITPDRDGKIRRIPMMAQDMQGNTYPSLSLAMLYACQPPVFLEEYKLRSRSIDLPDRSIPISASTGMLINYAGTAGQTFTTISYRDVIQAVSGPELDSLREKVQYNLVMVGVTAAGHTADLGGDNWLTPISQEAMYGVEVHANALHTILSGNFLTESGPLSSLLAVFVLALLAALILPRLELRWGLPAILALSAAYIAIAVYIYYAHGHIPDLVYPPLSLALLFTGNIAARAVMEQRNRREMSELFGKYVSSPVVDEILQAHDAGSLKLGGEEREATVLFADIRGFTEMAESLGPQETVQRLNRCFSLIIDRVLSNRGLISKFAGDSLMAVWNVPRLEAEHARLAVQAAIESQRGLEALLHEDTTGLPAVHMGFGISSGKVIAGNIGSMGRLEYTVIGDAVNVAARLCSLAPGGQIWISGTTLESASCPEMNGRSELLGPTQIKGRKEAVVVYRMDGQGSSGPSYP